MFSTGAEVEEVEELEAIEPEESSDPFSDGGFTSDDEDCDASSSSSDTDIDSYVSHHLRTNPDVGTVCAAVDTNQMVRVAAAAGAPTRRSFRRSCACLLLLLLLSLLQCCGLRQLPAPDSAVLSASAAVLSLPLALFLSRQPCETGTFGNVRLI